MLSYCCQQTYLLKSFQSYYRNDKYHFGLVGLLPHDEIEKNEMGRVCSAFWVGGEACIGFRSEYLRGRDHWGNPGIDGRIILRRYSGSGMLGYGLD
jgi:hypothetical protein